MYRLLLLLTYILHPNKDIRVFCLIYSLLSFTLSMTLITIPTLYDNGNFFITIIVFETLVMITACKILSTNKTLLTLVIVEVLMIYYNYYEYKQYLLYLLGGELTSTYQHYQDINLAMLEFTMIVIWWGISMKDIKSRVKEMSLSKRVISGSVFLSLVIYLNMG